MLHIVIKVVLDQAVVPVKSEAQEAQVVLALSAETAALAEHHFKLMLLLAQLLFLIIKMLSSVEQAGQAGQAVTVD